MARARKRKKQGSGEFDPTRWAHATFALFAIMTAWLFVSMVEDVWGWAWSRWPASIGRPHQVLGPAIGIVSGLGLMVFLWTRERYFKFVCEVAVEVEQIIWRPAPRPARRPSWSSSSPSSAPSSSR
ncbi:MAG: hypothetical protein HC927_03850 [Deltaproteobacteria bacterium]|nr:hypothetical protein [Deltaproteobacteria bacterium]